MHTRLLGARSWLAGERTLLQYLVKPHDGHPYPEDLLDAICLITSWALIIFSVLGVLGVFVDGVLT
ncbi:MAG TPA: hypothetical protein VF159_00695 [Gemmatimonadaceae bacterium]